MRTLALVVALALLPGCFGPRTDTSRYFTLPVDGTPSAAAAIPALGLGPLTLPPYLSRPEVATRVGPEQVAYATGDRWAAPLDELVARALSEQLRARIPAREVVRWPWPLGSPPEVSASVELIRFEAEASGGATVIARWRVTPRGGRPIDGETRLRERGPAGDVPASVAALGKGLSALAADLAAAARAPAN
ncbi:MAG: PqiC family protein [Deltaproteobacteria bacterium]